jgi:hypothetical protein
MFFWIEGMAGALVVDSCHIEQEENQNTHTHKMRLASKVLLRRWESGVTRQTGRMEKREKRMWRGDSVHLFVHETEASRILPTERNQLHPPTRSRGIHIYIYRTSLYTTQAWASQQGPRTKSRTSFFFFFRFPDAPYFFSFPFTLPSPTEIGSLCQWRTPFPPVFCQSPDEWEILYKTMCTRWFRFGIEREGNGGERKKKWRYSSVRFLHRLDSGLAANPIIDTMEV